MCDADSCDGQLDQNQYQKMFIQFWLLKAPMNVKKPIHEDEGIANANKYYFQISVSMTYLIINFIIRTQYINQSRKMTITPLTNFFISGTV